MRPHILHRGCLGVCALAAWTLVAASAAPAKGFDEPTEHDYCGLEAGAASTVLEGTARPQEGATVTAGDPVTFSASSRVPLTFVVASSPALLASPDIAQGLGEPLGEEHMQAFTSLNAAATVGTVYWQVFLHAAELPHCAGAEGIESLPPRSLVVEPGAAPTPQTPSPAPPADDFTVTIDASTVHVRRPVVTFRVRCTENCAGAVTCVAIVLRGHKKIRAPILDFRSRRVSIPNPGGVQSFSHDYAGAARRELTRLIRDRDALKLQITASVSNAGGHHRVAHTTIPLR